jgi:DNA-binding response OmpR family regulator
MMDILLIEDHNQIRELLERYLQRLGHDVVACGDGKVGLTAYKEIKFLLPSATDFFSGRPDQPRK